MSNKELLNLVSKLSNEFTKIIFKETLTKHKCLSWGNNGVGNRWAKKAFIYTVIYSNLKFKTYGNINENNLDFVNKTIIKNIFEIDLKKLENKKGIIGIIPHSLNKTNENRYIKLSIKKEIIKLPCVVCGSKSSIVCDHKNDFYNNPRVLSLKQRLSDFQPLCNHCNLQKRQVSKEEIKNKRLYSAKNLPMYKFYNFKFPWELKSFDINDKNNKKDLFWYDPVEFNKKIGLYITITLPIINELKKKQSKINKL